MTRGTIFGLKGTTMSTRSEVELNVTDRRPQEERYHCNPDATIKAVTVCQSGTVEFSDNVTAKHWTAAEMADMVFEVVRRWRAKQELS